MKKILFILLIIGCAQPLLCQKVAVKNNILYDAALTPNIGIEVGLSEKSTLDISGGYNPFNLGGYKQLKHWLVQPEYRYWFCEKFNGTFLGGHILGGEYSVADVKLPFGIFPSLKGNKYEGYFYGAGVSIGHQWIIGKRWNLEATLGLGYVRFEGDKYPCAKCGEKTGRSNYNYWGPTKAAVSFMYFFK